MKHSSTAETKRPEKSRYKARPARRPFLFWWQVFLLLAVAVFMWSLLPLDAVLFEPRASHALPSPRAAYVVLDPNFAALAFKKSLTAWTSGGTGEKSTSGLDIGGFDFGETLPPPSYLERGSRYPGVWRPADVAPLAPHLPDVRVPAAGSPPSANVKAAAPFQGVRTTLDRRLRAAAVAFAVPSDALAVERTGHARFYVETDSDGSVAHVLLLSLRTPGAAVLEHLLLCGHAAAAADGVVEVDWTVPKP
jgi:hypothetical protein